MEFDQSKYKVLNWKNFSALMWILNPGIAFNELVLGQRVPKILLIDKTSTKPLMERTYVHCPHCEEIHDGRLWAKQNKTAFKNWFGYYCRSCGGIIPCHRNIFSLLLLITTYPLWGWFKHQWKQKWLAKQPRRYQDVNAEKITYTEVPWMKIGLEFGGFMYIFMSLYFIIINSQDIIPTLLIGIPVWALTGLLFAYIMKVWMGKKGGKELKIKN